MNTYAKYCPNVYVAKCETTYEKGDVIEIETKYGKVNTCVVFNLVKQDATHFYYSIVRADGFNSQQRALNKAERLTSYSQTASKKSDQYYQASQEGRDFLSLGEPIKVGHHSEKRHRALIERNWNRMGKSVAYSEKAGEYTSRANYWESKANVIDLSLPESLEYFEHQLTKARSNHEGIKTGKIPARHSYSLSYARKEVRELEKKVETAKLLWG